MKKVVVGNFVRLKEDCLSVHKVGVKDILYVAGSTLLPTAEDSYYYKQHFVLARLKDNHVDGKSQGLLVGPEIVTPVGRHLQRKLNGIFESDHLKQAESSEVSN